MLKHQKCFPLPTYDLQEPNRVKVTLFGKILDRNYTQLLHANENLDLHVVFLLDKVQKHETISKDSFQILKKAGLVEGRYPNLFVSYKVANIVGQKTDYIRNKGLSNDVYKQIIINALKTMKDASVSELKEVLIGALPAIFDEKQQSKKVSNILQSMKRDGIADVDGTGHSARWFLVKKY